MWVIKFTFILFGVIYELLHYVVKNIYNALSKRIFTYFYKTNKGQA
jgi:hypothetical protein